MMERKQKNRHRKGRHDLTHQPINNTVSLTRSYIVTIAIIQTATFVLSIIIITTFTYRTTRTHFRR